MSVARKFTRRMKRMRSDAKVYWMYRGVKAAGRELEAT
jgi:hypothetical protein